MGQRADGGRRAEWGARLQEYERSGLPSEEHSQSSEASRKSDTTGTELH